MASKLKITLKRSVIGRPSSQRATVRALGLRKLNSVVEREDTPNIRGMVRRIEHLVQVDTLEGSEA